MKRPKAPQLEPLQELGVVAVNYDSHVNELNAYIDYLEVKAENLPISKVSGSSVDLGNDLYVLVDKYTSEGMSEYHAECRLLWVAARVNRNYR